MAEKTTTPPTADELFAGLTIGDSDRKKVPPARPPPMNRPGGENMPPSGRRGPPPPHRPSRSQEEALRARRQRPNGDGPSSPPRRAVPPRPRRNSDSSLAERPLTDEEKKARERRRRERDDRKRREGGGREARDSKGKPRRHHDMDLIDSLDATSIYGTGIFHHAGPYDAVIQSRSTTNKRPSPMEAFAKDSANMSMGGSGPLNSRADHATFMGVATDEAYIDFSTGAPPARKDPAVFDPHRRASVIYGDNTDGLGTTTFLEGTPAARAAVQKAEQESTLLGVDNGGLQRKKSLAQRIRGINRPPRGEFPPPSGRLTNPDGAYRDHVSSASMSSSRNEANPFFAEYEPSKDGEEQISVRETGGGQSTPPLPGSLERRSTTDALGGLEGPKKASGGGGGGLLGRMKSLKGGPRRPSNNYNGEAA